MPLRNSPNPSDKQEKYKQLHQEIAEYIVQNPDIIFSEYQELYKVISQKEETITPREVSIIYRREVGNTKDPDFTYIAAAVTWLINNSKKELISPIEMVNFIEANFEISPQKVDIKSDENIQALQSQIQKTIKEKLKFEDDNSAELSDYILHKMQEGDDKDSN